MEQKLEQRQQDSEHAIFLGWLEVCLNLLDTAPSKGEDAMYGGGGGNVEHNAMYRQNVANGRGMNKRTLPMENMRPNVAASTPTSLIIAIRDTTPDNVKKFLTERKISRAEAVSQLGNDASSGKLNSWLQGKSTSWNGAVAIRQWLTRIYKDEMSGVANAKRPRSISSSQPIPPIRARGVAPGMGGPGYNSVDNNNNIRDYHKTSATNIDGPQRKPPYGRSGSQYNMDDFIMALKAVTNKKHDEEIKHVLEVYVRERRKPNLSNEEKEAHGKTFIKSLRQICGEEAMSAASARVKNAALHGAHVGQQMSSSRRSSLVSNSDMVGSSGQPPMKQEMRYQGKSGGMVPQSAPSQAPGRAAGAAYSGRASFSGDAGRRQSQYSPAQVTELIRAWNHGCQCTNDNCPNETCRRIKPKINHQRELKKRGEETRPCRPDCSHCNFYIQLGKLSRNPETRPGHQAHGMGAGRGGSYPGHKPPIKGAGMAANSGTKQQVIGPGVAKRTGEEEYYGGPVRQQAQYTPPQRQVSGSNFGAGGGGRGGNPPKQTPMGSGGSGRYQNQQGNFYHGNPQSNASDPSYFRENMMTSPPPGTPQMNMSDAPYNNYGGGEFMDTMSSSHSNAPVATSDDFKDLFD